MSNKQQELAPSADKNPNALAVLDSQTLDKIADEIETIVGTYGVQSIQEFTGMKRSIALATGIQNLKELLSPTFCKQVLTQLAGSVNGFLTDKDNEDQKYSGSEIRECAITALLNGFELVGNEFNIIGKKFYPAKNGLERKVKNFPGLSNFKLQLGKITPVGDKSALVQAKASWLFQGREMELICDEKKETNKETGEVFEFDERVPVRVNAGMGPDGIHGKTERKMYYRIHKILSNVDLPDPDVIDTEGHAVGESPKNAAALAAKQLVEKHAQRAQDAKRDPAADSSGHAEPGAGG